MRIFNLAHHFLLIQILKDKQKNTFSTEIKLMDKGCSHGNDREKRLEGIELN